MVVTVTKNGYLKRTALDTYRKQSRGGRGRRGMATRDDDLVERLFIGRTHSYILVFTNLGRVYWLKIYNIPDVGTTGRGRNIVNIIALQPGETVQAFRPVKDFDADKFIVMATKKGVVKKCSLEVFSRPLSRGIIALGLDEGDELVSARLLEEGQEIFLATRKGQAVRFEHDQVRAMGRTARGVRGIKLADDDETIGLLCVDKESLILTTTENGYGKRTRLGDYRLTKRGGKGVINIKITKTKGRAVVVMKVADEDDLMIITRNGKIIRIGSGGIRATGRISQGVLLVNLGGDDVVAAAAVAPRTDEIDEEIGEDDNEQPAAQQTLTPQ